MFADPIPISSDEAIVKYLSNAGMLADIGLSPEAALAEIKELDARPYYHPPAEHAAEVYAIPPTGLTPLTAEFDKTEAIVITWPMLYPYRWPAAAHMTAGIVSARAQVFIMVSNLFWQKAVMLYLTRAAALDLTQVRFLYIDTEKFWSRDYVPFSLRSTEGLVFVGGSYARNPALPTRRDTLVSAEIARHFSRPLHRLPLNLEGGNLITDGQGTCLMFDAVRHQNPTTSLSTLEHLLDDYLGCARVILIPTLPGDTLGHIDMIAMFLNQSTLLVAHSDPQHAWYTQLESIAQLLARTPAVHREHYRIERVPLASQNHTTTPVWSYTNSLIVNDTVLIPIFGIEPSDSEARKTFERLMPAHRIMGIRFDDILSGAIHCSTMQLLVDEGTGSGMPQTAYSLANGIYLPVIIKR